MNTWRRSAPSRISSKSHLAELRYCPLSWTPPPPLGARVPPFIPSCFLLSLLCALSPSTSLSLSRRVLACMHACVHACCRGRAMQFLVNSALINGIPTCTMSFPAREECLPACLQSHCSCCSLSFCFVFDKSWWPIFVADCERQGSEEERVYGRRTRVGAKEMPIYAFAEPGGHCQLQMPACL